MTIAVVQSKAQLFSSSPLTVTLGSAPTNGNWLVCFCFSNSSGGPPAAASGWTLVNGTHSSSFVAPGYYYKKAGAGESTSQTVSSSTSFADICVMFEISGLSGTTFSTQVLQSYASNDYADDTNYDSANPNVTTSADGIVLWATGIRDGGGAAHVPTSITGLNTVITGVESGNRAGAGGYSIVSASTNVDPAVTWNATTDQVGYSLMVLNGIVNVNYSLTMGTLTFTNVIEAMTFGLITLYALVMDGLTFSLTLGPAYAHRFFKMVGNTYTSVIESAKIGWHYYMSRPGKPNIHRHRDPDGLTIKMDYKLAWHNLEMRWRKAVNKWWASLLYG